ncbi:MAG: POTRA domain-containing protein [Candidatus Firestonebacteria bacterium]
MKYYIVNKRFFVSIFFIIPLFISTLTPVFAGYSDEDSGRGETFDRGVTQERVKVELPVEMLMKEKVELERPKPTLPEAPVFIRQINVVGVTVLSKKDTDQIISDFQNRQLSGKEMQRCADQITDWYSIKGYITSYAYVEPARLNEEILEIKCVEGKVGKVTIEGNRHFSTRIYEERIGLKTGEPFNLKLLKNNAYKINKHPDRKILAMKVEPADEPGLANITLKIKDRIPFHLNPTYDNYGSQWIFQNRYKVFYVFNNFTGHDDVLSAKSQFAETDAQKLYDLDYFLPLTNDLKFEFYAMPYKIEDFYGDREDIDRVKKAMDFKTNLIKTFIDKPGCFFEVSLGFGYWDISWFQYGKTWRRRDWLRAVLFSQDLNISDKFGRTSISNDAEFAIPDFMGGLKAKDENANIPGAGSGYIMSHLVVDRQQKLFHGIDLLLRSHFQISSNTLAGVKKFCIGGTGGVVDNRGYPRAQYVGDSGKSISIGLSFPPYFVPRNLNVPFSKTKLYNTLKFIPTYDLAQGRLKSTPPGEKADATFRSAGCALKFDLPEHSMSLRVDTFWPVGGTYPADGDRCHTWIYLSKDFAF